MTKILLNNDAVCVKIIKKNLYFKFKNINDMDKNIEQFIFIYKYISMICHNHNIKYIMILDFTTTNINILNVPTNIPIFIKMLNEIKPLTNTTVKYTILILNSDIIKYIMNSILNIYKNGRPIYIINNEEDIIQLLS